MRFRSALLLAVFALILLPTLSFAQTGSITGTVTDTAGAVVPAAKVIVQNTETGASRSVVTSDTGAYSVTPLAVGNYNITVEGKGFRTAKINGVKVTVAQVFALNVKLVVGAVNEVVEVKGDQIPQVDTETSSVSQIVDNKKIEALPMITRDPYSLVLLSTGTIQSDSGLGGFSVNGARERNNNFTLDGTDNNDTSVPGIPGGISSISPEATEEFRVITNNFMPEFGRNTGAIVDIVTKSGTNEYHGEGHWFGRYNSIAGARDYFNPGLDKATKSADMQACASGDNGACIDLDNARQNPYVRNTFGYSFGGPIQKDKTFFFFNNEFQRFRTSLTSYSTVPSDSVKAGIVTAPDGTTLDVNDPASLTNATGFVGMDPKIKQVLALYPSPTVSVDANRGLFYFPTASTYNYYGLTAKIDHRFTDKEQLSLRYIFNTSSDPGAFHDAFLPGYGATGTNQKSHNYSADFTSTLSNTLINSLKVGFNRTDAAFYCGGLDKMNILGTDTYGRGIDLVLPGLTSFACASLGDSDAQARRTGTYTFNDALTWVKGAHTMKFGGEFRFIYDNGYDDFSSRESLGFSTYSNWGAPSFYPADITTQAQLNTWLGTVPSYVQNMGWMLTGSIDSDYLAEYFNKAGDRSAQDFRRFRQREYAGFFQDSWKMRPNFTLNYGLRYAFNGVPYETGGNLSNLFANPSGPGPFTFSLVGPGNGKLLYNNDFSMIEPRFGFAWDPFSNGKTSVRGGFGIFHDRVFGNLFGNAKSNPPFESDYSAYPLADGNPTLLSNFTAAPQTTPSATIENWSLIFPTLIDPNLKMPRSMNWNFGIQRQLTSSLSLDVDYVGSQADRILRVLDGNAPVPSLVQQALALGADPTQMTGAGLWYYTFGEGTPCYIGDGCPNQVAVVGNNAFLQAGLNESISKSSYNSLQTKLTKRMSHGVKIDAAYTWAHASDNASDPLVAAAGNRTFPRNSYNLNAEWGNSDFDMRHRIVVDYTLELPFGKGTSHLANGPIGRVLEGWSASGITSWQTGHPFDVFADRDSQHAGLSDRAEMIGDPNAAPANINPALGYYFGPDKSAFGRPAWNTASNLGRNQFYGPHYTTWNMVVSKKMKFNERFNGELRFEGYNVFNHPNFTQPDNAWADSTFGYSLGQVGNSDGTTGARQLQFGLKLNF